VGGHRRLLARQGDHQPSGGAADEEPRALQKERHQALQGTLASPGHPLLRAAGLLQNPFREGTGDRVLLQLHRGERARGLQQVRGRLGESHPRHFREGAAELALHNFLRRDRLAGRSQRQKVPDSHPARRSATASSSSCSPRWTASPRSAMSS
jgi:hypothetical protein